MTSTVKLDPSKTAVLTLDIQEGIVSRVPNPAIALPAASSIVEFARKSGMLLIHVGLGFEPGYPEISEKNARFGGIKEAGHFLKGSDSAKFHSSVYKAGDLIVYKHRFSAFAGNALHMILQAKGIETLVFFGFSTSGIVLSTIRTASDLDYKCIIIKDACSDRDEEVHRVLTEKVFTSQATVLTAKEFLAQQSL